MCARCGQLSIAADGLCPDCQAGLYGGLERHEAPRLFAPAPVPLAGQLDIRLNDPANASLDMGTNRSLY